MKSILYFLILFLFANLVLADWCYQETATVSTPCGGLSTGSYRCTGNWNVVFTDYA